MPTLLTKILHKDLTMPLIDKRSFDFEGHTFLMVLNRGESEFQVRAFIDTQVVSPTYSVSFETNNDLQMQNKESAVEMLFNFAKTDIENHLYFKG